MARPAAEGSPDSIRSGPDALQSKATASQPVSKRSELNLSARPSAHQDGRVGGRRGGRSDGHLGGELQGGRPDVGLGRRPAKRGRSWSRLGPVALTPPCPAAA